MGKPSRRRGKKGKGGASGYGQAAAGEGAEDSTASSSAADLAITNVTVSLRAKLEFHEATAEMGTSSLKLERFGMPPHNGGTCAVVPDIRKPVFYTCTVLKVCGKSLCMCRQLLDSRSRCCSTRVHPVHVSTVEPQEVRAELV